MKRSRDTNALISIGIVGLIILFGAPQTLDLFGIISLTTAVSLAILAFRQQDYQVSSGCGL